ncbi:MAG TPA: hypothetical protein VH877_03570 [Polyangia bacterium]|jgi:hypothetical protein|nr:hypothetical protein [Polyangia bacterium]
MKLWAQCFGVLLLTACATPQTVLINGQQVPRIQLGYTDGRYFAFTHKGAVPVAPEQRPANVFDGGRIYGIVCGLDFTYDVWYRGGSIILTGFVRRNGIPTRNNIPSQLYVRDRDGVREISGYVGQTIGYSTIDLQLTPDALHGRVARRHYDLVAGAEDGYTGTVEQGGYSNPFTGWGRQALWSMPPEDQAVLLSKVLACSYLYPWSGASRWSAPIQQVYFARPSTPAAPPPPPAPPAP